MKAILLAAGRGRRLGIDGPKVLVEINGKSLLQSHLENMVSVGIRRVVIVMGHAHEQLKAATEAILNNWSFQGADAPEVSLVFNEQFKHGSLVSLQKALSYLEGEGGIWMDADVYYPAALLGMLVDSKHPNCVLLDGRSTSQGEEMMLGVREGRVGQIARTVGTDWDLVGESIGFFKVGSAGLKTLRAVFDQEVAENRLDQEHEDGLNKTFTSVPFSFERADAFPWTEIDFPDDIEKAKGLVASIANVASPAS